jgi:putative transposase
MHVTERSRGDRRKLAGLMRAESNAKQRDRLRAVALALEGHETLAIAERLGRSRAFVQRWVYAYRDHGLGGIRARKAPGRTPFLTGEEAERFRDRVTRGAQPEDGIATLRGRELQQILEKEFGKLYSLNGVYNLLHRLGFACLEPRPRHPKSDPAAIGRFKRSAPLFSGERS